MTQPTIKPRTGVCIKITEEAKLRAEAEARRQKVKLRTLLRKMIEERFAKPVRARKAAAPKEVLTK